MPHGKKNIVQHTLYLTIFKEWCDIGYIICVTPEGRALLNCNYVYRLVSQVYISWWAYVFIRPGSLGVKGQEPDFVYVIM